MKRFILVLALLCFAILATAQIQVTQQFYNKSLYVPNSPILVKITIKNNSPAVYRFKLADNRMFSLRFEMKTLTNRILEPADTWKRTISSSIPIFYREIAIQPGEEYAFVEDVQNYVKITEAGTYVFECYFYPELYSRQDMVMKSDPLTVSIRPELPVPTAVEMLNPQINEILKAEKIPPDEVVRRTIIARQKGKWNEFFLYFDIEALLSQIPEKKRMYQKESDEGRRRMIEAYKSEVIAGYTDKDLAAIPSSFEILETRYSATRGTVQVLEKFAYSGFVMLKLYIYELEKRDDIWYIVSYSIQNKGTE
ncbi:MAG TPA: hypothetical protein P5519_01625 [Spirochaetia bacterium]|nr:hypothetical protein [Spirochaetales bacterium]HPD80171.1 hypothetical protein [Spirochaetales bacterium]HRS64572.1 hypothetical protein [Spirochaetia bacterium]HRV28052.1 hypothetical protein [Spirochaetia bacterium]